MLVALTTWGIVATAPFAFALGVAAGLAGASRWRIVKRKEYER